MDTPFLSVIIPVYNVEPYLRECLDSIFSQVRPDVEVIAVNDGSTDGCPAILSDYAEREPSLRIIHTENKGISSARNTGLKASKGDFVFFVDSDDLVAPGALQASCSILAGEKLDFLEMDFIRFSDGSSLETAILTKPERGRYPGITAGNGQELFADWVRSGFFRTAPWTRIYSSRFLRENDLYFIDGLIFEDAEWVPRVFRCAQRGKYVPVTLYLYRDDRQGSVMTRYGASSFPKAYRALVFISDELYRSSSDPEITPSFSGALRRRAGKLLVRCITGVWTYGDDALIDSFREELRSRWYRIRSSGSLKWKMMYFIMPLIGIENVRRIFLAFRRKKVNC